MTKEQDELIEKSQAPLTVPIEGPSIIVHNIYDDYKHLFNKQAQEAADKEKPSKLLDGQQYFAWMVKDKKDIPKAVQELVNTINYYAEKGYVTKFLIPLSYLELPFGDLPLNFAVFSWPVFTKEGFDEVEVDKPNCLCKEGEIMKARI